MKYSAQFVAALAATTVQAFPTSLEGQSFKITVVVADGFVMKVDDTSYEGYVIDMINMVADRANFTFDLKTPSGSGSQCDDSTNVDIDMYGSAFESQYLCGQDDVLDGNVPVLEHVLCYTCSSTRGKVLSSFQIPFRWFDHVWSGY